MNESFVSTRSIEMGFFRKATYGLMAALAFAGCNAKEEAPLPVKAAAVETTTMVPETTTTTEAPTTTVAKRVVRTTIPRHVATVPVKPIVCTIPAGKPMATMRLENGDCIPGTWGNPDAGEPSTKPCSTSREDEPRYIAPDGDCQIGTM